MAPFILFIFVLLRIFEMPAVAKNHGEFNLRVLSYNIQGMPVGVTHDRYAEIGSILNEARKDGSAPHIVTIQEAFVARTRELNQNAGYPFVAKGPASSGLKMSSGLYVLSEFPMTETNQIVYGRCISWDCAARKGALHTRIEIPGVPQPIEIFTTHLNSDPESDPSITPKDAEQVRIDQVMDLGLFMKKVKVSQAPGIFAGDFNFHPGGLDYLFFTFHSNMKNSTERCAVSESCSGDPNPAEDLNSSFDHQFFISGSSPEIKIQVTHFERTFKERVNGQYLSDHTGLEIHYQLSW